MAKIIDLKSLGISQDVKELKSERARSSGYYNQNIEKKRLALMQEAYKTSQKSKANRDIGYKVISQDKKDLDYQEKIAKQKQKISSNSFLGRAKQGLSRVGSKVNKFANERAINRQVIRKSNVSVRLPTNKIENVFEDENRFFKGEMAKEKKAMFFS